MARATVFYSWQSDLPGKMNRSLIEAALEGAAEALAADGELKISPVIDRDTQGLPGSPDIGHAIFAKIAESAAFVCDVSFINRNSDGGRLTPNPNVLIELGYALRALGWERILLVFNRATGRIEDLPFDLRQKRALTYESGEADTERAPARAELKGKLVVALREILRHATAPQPGPPPADKAIAAIRGASPDAAAAAGDYMAHLAERIAEAKPQPQEGRSDDELVVEAVNGSVDLVIGFGGVAEEVARHGHREAALRLHHGFEGLLAQYRRPPRTGGVFRNSDFDLPKFLGHELFVSFIAAMLRHGRLAIVSEIVAESLMVDGDDGYAPQRYWRLSTGVGSLHAYFQRRGESWLSPQAEVLKSRHSDGGALARATPWRSFIDADYFLYLRSAFELSEGEHPFGHVWTPWSFPYLEAVGTPAWLAKAVSRRSLETLLPVFGVKSIDEFRKRYAAHARAAARLFPDSFSFDPRLPSPESLGSSP